MEPGRIAGIVSSSIGPPALCCKIIKIITLAQPSTRREPQLGHQASGRCPNVYNAVHHLLCPSMADDASALHGLWLDFGHP